MKKKLVFAFSVFENCIDNRAIKIHLESLRYYKYVFDEALFVFMGEREYAIPVIEKLLGFGFKDIQFKFREIDNLWESGVLYDEIVNTDKCDDKLVFFGHTKGVTNYNRFDNWLNFDRWITGMYFFNLEFNKEVTKALTTFEFSETFGVYITNLSKEGMLANNANAIYAGTFYWLNIGKIKSHCKKMPPLYNRWYAELFPGNVVLDNSYMCRYSDIVVKDIINKKGYYDGIIEYFNTIMSTVKKNNDSNEIIELYNKYISNIDINIEKYDIE